MAELLIEVLREKMRSGKMAILDFVIVPDHVHVLLTVPGEMSLEKAMQLIKKGVGISRGDLAERVFRRADFG
jgi:putative transposase